jgi:D-alanine-D-alanine ligase-like ATP-grasp enzyme
VECFYFDRALRAHAVSAKQMYSNTPSDFDFKLRGRAGGDDTSADEPAALAFFPDPASLASHLAARRAVAFPAVHGTFGEDGSLQAVLEEAGVPFVGAGAGAAGAAFDKALCASALAAAGFPTLRAALVEAHDGSFPSRLDVVKKLTAWFADESLDPERAWVVVKPCGGGSSLGVSAARGVDEAADAAVALLGEPSSVSETASFPSPRPTRVLVERHAGGGAEFTVVVVETARGPVALAPTEVEVFPSAEGAEGQTPERDERDRVFDFRAKYLPSSRVAYRAPARFGEEGVARVRRRAEEAFRALGLRDCARLDGFYMPRDHPAVSWTNERGANEDANDANGEEEKRSSSVVFEPVFADVNVASGMEQTSFLFLQAAQAGMSHGAALRGVLASACRREGVPARFRSDVTTSEREGAAREPRENFFTKKTKVYVLFGGNTSERQVSLTSGVNVWLKLRSRPDFDVTPALLAPDGLDLVGSKLEDATVFRLSYARALRHTVEEAAAAARAREERFAESFSKTGAAREDYETNVVRAALRDGGFFYDAFDADDDVEKDALTQSRASSLRAFASLVKKENAVVFLSVHGGVGEDGTLQAFFETNGVAFTGSGAAASRLCMDKSATGAALAAARLEGVTTCRKVTVTAWEMSEALASAAAAAGGASASDDIRRRRRDPAGAWWARLVASVGGDARDGLCIKPNSDGCSTGVARLRSSADLWQYATAVTRGAATAAVGDQRVAMPSPPPFAFVLEPFVVASAVEVFFDERAGTENVRFKKDNADARRLATNEEAVITTGQPLLERDSPTTAPRVLIEITAGVYGAFGAARCLPPSATVAERACAVLSLEEKFQGGTGVNLTPVPPELIEARVLETIERRIASAANALGVEGFARIDAFADARTGDVVVIEANTVPGMTPSTVLFHQALAETPSIEPAAFLARAVEHAVRRRDDAMPGTGDGAEERFRRASARVEREER